MYLSIIILPLLGSLISGLLGRKIGLKGSQLISCSCLFLSAVLSTFAFYEVGISGSPVSIKLGTWIDSEIMQVTWEFLFDQLSVVFCIMITYITFLILVYTVYYMEGQPQSVMVKRKYGEKLSNSGDTLKIIVPNNSRKVISGWTNYSGRVTSYNMSENEMGYRGSKSVLNINVKTVKEQRANGSWCIKSIPYASCASEGQVDYKSFVHLRCALMGCESSYLVKNPSKQLNTNTKNYSTYRSLALQAQAPHKVWPSDIYPKINPWFWTGLIDAEGSFTVSLAQSKALACNASARGQVLNWEVKTKFTMGIHIRDSTILLKLRNYLNGLGSIDMDYDGNRAIYSMDSSKDLKILIDHLNKYPLLSQKGGDFILWSQIVEMINNRLHLTKEELHQIVSMKASMNLGLSEKLKSEFSFIRPANRPVINIEKIPNSNWIVGFVSGVGNFDVQISQSTINEIKSRVQLRFRLSQHINDINLMEKIKSELGAGRLYRHPNGIAVTLTVSNLSDITDIIIPYFEKNIIVGIKLYDYKDWCKIHKLLLKGTHLTIEGLKLIRKIKLGMNSLHRWHY